MSQSKATGGSTQDDFEHLIRKHYGRHKDALRIAAPTFKKEGYVTTATMLSSCGRVEIRCAPPEYHAEVFVYTDDGKRWSLLELIAIIPVRKWLEQNRPSTFDTSRLDAEVDCAFGLLAHGLKDAGPFRWLHAT